MKKLTNAELKEVELNLLLRVNEICKQYNIVYFLAFGTLLGG